MEYWKDKVAVVTGASSGIGAAIALNLANSGVKVVGLARREYRIKELAKQTTGELVGIECDVGKKESILNAFKVIEEKYGTVDILVNNAGRNNLGSILDPEYPHDQILETINTNFAGLVICTREAFRLMRNHQNKAYIININSIAGHSSAVKEFLPGNVYAATKHAVTNHTQALRLEIATSKHKKRIRVSSVSPGFVKTEILEAGGASQEMVDGALRECVHILPGEVANAVQYLLSSPPEINITEITIKPTGEAF